MWSKNRRETCRKGLKKHFVESTGTTWAEHTKAGEIEFRLCSFAGWPLLLWIQRFIGFIGQDPFFYWGTKELAVYPWCGLATSQGPQQGLRRLGTAWALELLELSWTLRVYKLFIQFIFSLFVFLLQLRPCQGLVWQVQSNSHLRCVTILYHYIYIYINCINS